MSHVMPVIEMHPFTPDMKSEWDDFIANSKNGTFLMKRDYMDYHSHRMDDHSFLFYRKNKLYCVLPATNHENSLDSHQGLTYGGLIMGDACTASGIMQVFSILLAKLKEEKIEKLIYKPVPHIYHSQCAEEDLYALFRYKAILTERKISSCIHRNSFIRLAPDRRAAIRKASKNNLMIERSHAFGEFWEILKKNLFEKYGAFPVHSLSEITFLANKFPENIQLFTASQGGQIIGGIVCYISQKVIHTQYISADKRGKSMGAIDALISYLFDNIFTDRFSYFDFGTSCENHGEYLNESLIYQKEGFGARGICYDTYEIVL